MNALVYGGGTRPVIRHLWTADRSGIGHCSLPGRGRALCGSYATAESMSYPIRLYCGACHEALDAAEQPPLVKTLPTALGEALEAVQRGVTGPGALADALGISYPSAMARLVRLRELGLAPGGRVESLKSVDSANPGLRLDTHTTARTYRPEDT